MLKCSVIYQRAATLSVNITQREKNADAYNILSKIRNKLQIS